MSSLTGHELNEGGPLLGGHSLILGPGEPGTRISKDWDELSQSEITPQAETVCEVIGSTKEHGSMEETVEAQDSESLKAEIVYPSPVYYRRGWRTNPEPVAFATASEWALRWRNRIVNAADIVRWSYNDLLDEEEPRRSNLHRFLTHLRVFHEYQREKPYSVEFLWNMSMSKGPSFAKDLDNLRSATIGKTFNLGYLSDEIAKIEETYEVRKLSASHFRIGSLYRPNFLFNWEAPELKLEDVSFAPVETDPVILENFRIAIRNRLKHPKLLLFEEIPWEDLERDSSTASFNGKVYQQARQVPANVRGKSRLVQIARELKEKRLACVEEYSSLLRIRWIDANVRSILTVFKQSAMKLKPETIRLKLETMVGKRNVDFWKRARWDEPSRTVYCRDFKKEGLTKPRIILRIMLEELHRRFPSAKVFDQPGFFDHWNVYEKTASGEFTYKCEPPRGHGLGMANALTTLMQLGIEDLNVAGSGVEVSDSLYYNDDAVAFFKRKIDAEQYARADKLICAGLGLKYKAKASFLGVSFCVLCEQYASNIAKSANDKRIYHLQEFANLFCGINVAHARSIAMSMNLHGIPVKLQRSLLEYWGWVLFRNEHQMPRNLGGWFREIISGCDISYLSRVGALNVSDESFAALRAYDKTKLVYFPWLKKPRKYPRKNQNDFDKEYHELVFGDKPMTVETMHRPSMTPSITTNAWNRYLTTLRLNYRQFYRKGKMTYKEAWLHQSELLPQCDIFPPIGEFKIKSCRDGLSTLSDATIHHPFRGHGPRLDFQIWKDNHRNEYSLKTRNPDTIQPGWPKYHPGIHGSMDAANYHRYVGPLSVSNMYKPKYYHVFVLPDKEMERYYHNPFHAQKVSDALFRDRFANIVPIGETPQSRLIKLRSLIYGRKLSLEEWLDIGHITPSDQRLVMYISTPQHPLDESDFKELTSLLKRYPGLGHLFNYESSYDIGARESVLASKLGRWIYAANLIREPDPESIEELADEFQPMALDLPERVVRPTSEGSLFMDHDEKAEILEYDEWGDLKVPDEDDVPEGLVDDYHTENRATATVEEICAAEGIEIVDQNQCLIPDFLTENDEESFPVYDSDVVAFAFTDERVAEAGEEPAELIR